MFQYLTLFGVGFLELFLGTIDFKFTQRNRFVLASLSTYLHVMVWVYIIVSLFEGWHQTLPSIQSYAFGCAIGKYYAMKYDDILDKKITRIQRKGRKIKRGKLFGRKK